MYRTESPRVLCMQLGYAVLWTM